MAKSKRKNGVGSILVNSVINSINEGHLKEHQRLEPIRRLSEEFGICNRSVINALKQLEEEGWLYSRPRSGYYVASGAKRRSGKAQELALVVASAVDTNDHGDPMHTWFLAPMLHELLKQAPQYGFEIALRQLEPDAREDPERRLAGFRGFITLGSPAYLESVLKLARANKLPMVHANEWTAVIRDTDNSEAIWYSQQQKVQAACDHLLKLGHRRIAMVTHNRLSGSRGLEFEMYALHKEFDGVVIREELFRDEFDDDFADMGYRAAHRVFELDPRPTAVLARDDRTAWGVLKYCHEQRISVPKEISVIGMSDLQIAQHCLPTLSSVRPPYEDITAECFKAMKRRLRDPDLPPRAVMLTNCTVVERESCAPVEPAG